MTVPAVQSVNGLCNGLGSLRPTRIPLLNARHRAARFAWAREHRDWSVEDWKQVAWSDESRFRLLNADGSLRIWLQDHEAMNTACQVGTIQEHDDSIMVWDVSSWHCLGSLGRVPTSLDAIWNVEFLGDHFHPFMLLCYAHGMEFSSKTTVPLTSHWLIGMLEEGMKGHHIASTNLTESWTALANISKSFPWNVPRNLLILLCLVVWQPLSRPEETQLVTR
ncbi:transposable element Tc1 transposase [Trichonephila clavipes]|nr:transposable element Tc1 transposase [Trichonephila clavipes]